MPLLASAAGEVSPRPRSWTESVVATDRARLLTEMRARRILAKDAQDWTPLQYTLLLRLREAEALGAFSLLRAKLGTLRGMAAEHKKRDKLWLTQDGYQRFIFYLSQNARTYFESKGAEAKWVFETRSLEGKPLFTTAGLLTQEGIEVYNRVSRDLPVHWKYPNGYVTGTVRPPDAGIVPAPKSLPPAPSKKLAALVRSGYVEISQSELGHLLRAAKMTEGELVKNSSLQIIPLKKRTIYLLSPSDPGMVLVSQLRAAPPVK